MKSDEEARYVEYVRLRLPWLRKVGYLLTQDWHRADDVVQAAITQVYVHWRRVSGSDNIDAYVRTVLVRVFLSERRSIWSQRVDLTGTEPSVASQDGDDRVATRIAVRTALATVPDRQRATLVLRYFLDLSVEETAEAMGCSPGTVKSQTARGLETLRRQLGEVDPAAQLTVRPLEGSA